MSDPRRRLPAVDTLLALPDVTPLLAAQPRGVVLRAAREALDAARADGGEAPAEGWGTVIAARVRALAEARLGPVINLTGVVLHTNLGRAPLAPAAVRAMTAVARGYSNLEYDLGRGARGSRQALCRNLLTELTGAESALVVNNAAGALLLALGALAPGAGVAVSRGELVEVGGGFRIPEIMARSGARLMEIGSTNRTHKKDYEQAIAAGARLLLKVHRSNFQVTGFTAELEPAEVAGLARAQGLSSLFDLGSGLLLDLTPWGLSGEPTVPQAVAAGFDLVVFSGDKLLGGPQAGILVGRRAAIEACQNDPVARAVRADKLTLAALEATLGLYRDPAVARAEIPVLQMLTADTVEVRRRGEALKQGAQGKATTALADGFSEVGGGSFPGAKLPTVLVELALAGVSPDALLERLRGATPPVIARIERDRVVLDPRTLLPDQLDVASAAIRSALDG